MKDVLDALHEVADALSKHVDDRLVETRHEMKDFVDRRIGNVEAKIGTLVDVLEKKKVLTAD